MHDNNSRRAYVSMFDDDNEEWALCVCDLRLFENERTKNGNMNRIYVEHSTEYT